MIRIRKLKREDINTIRQFGKKFDEYMITDTDLFYAEDEMREWIGKKDNVFLVAEHDKNIVGFIFCKMISHRWALLDTIYVDPVHRGKGVGTHLFNALHDELKNRKVHYIQTTARLDNRKSRKFWDKHGFNKGKKFMWLDKTICDGM